VSPAAHPVVAIVVTHDSAEVLPACLDALGRAGVPVLVVDNASTDGSPDIAAARGAKVIRNRINEGYGRANNMGARAADAEFLLIVNPDVEVDEAAVAELVAAARRYPDAGLFAPRIVEPDGRVFYQATSLLAAQLTNPGGRLVVPEGDACAPFFSGACFMATRELLLQLGGFDEAIFLFYEDDDLCRRIADAGAALVYVPSALARHRRGGSSTPAPGRIFNARWHQAWSRAYVSRKYGLPNPAPRMLLLNAAKALAACLTLQRPVIERYAGSAAGALAYLRGRTALERQRLGGAR
jgi:N-acetylglucosaminyl-diphospho-decaprenol L-rhamnosyltransferase